jgi:hypothetical protein
MKGQLHVKTPDQYLARLKEPRRSEVGRLDELVRATVPQLERCIVSGVLAYGPVHYRYASGREGDTARLAIASNASAISFYVFAADEHGWLAERYRARFPRANVGKCCIRFKRFDDLDLRTLKALLREAATMPLPAHGGEVRETKSTPRPPRRAAAKPPRRQREI